MHLTNIELLFPLLTLLTISSLTTSAAARPQTQEKPASLIARQPQVSTADFPIHYQPIQLGIPTCYTGPGNPQWPRLDVQECVSLIGSIRGNLTDGTDKSALFGTRTWSSDPAGLPSLPFFYDSPPTCLIRVVAKESNAKQDFAIADILRATSGMLSDIDGCGAGREAGRSGFGAIVGLGGEKTSTGQSNDAFAVEVKKFVDGDAGVVGEGQGGHPSVLSPEGRGILPPVNP